MLIWLLSVLAAFSFNVAHGLSERVCRMNEDEIQKFARKAIGSTPFPKVNGRYLCDLTVNDLREEGLTKDAAITIFEKGNNSDWIFSNFPRSFWEYANANPRIAYFWLLPLSANSWCVSLWLLAGSPEGILTDFAPDLSSWTSWLALALWPEHHYLYLAWEGLCSDPPFSTFVAIVFCVCQLCLTTIIRLVKLLSQPLDLVSDAGVVFTLAFIDHKALWHITPGFVIRTMFWPMMALHVALAFSRLLCLFGACCCACCCVLGMRGMHAALKDD